MLSFSAAAMAEMSRPAGCSPVREVYLTLPTVGDVNLTARLVNITDVESKMPAVGFDCEVGQLTIVVNNADGYFSPDRSGSVFAGLNWQSSPLSAWFGVTLPNGAIETVCLWLGLLDVVEIDAGGGTAVFKAIQAVERPKNCGTGPLSGHSLYYGDGTVRHDDAPMGLIRDILGLSGYLGLDPAYYDDQSISATAQEERREWCCARDFRFGASSWWSDMENLLRHGGSVLRVNENGKICVASRLPCATRPTFTIPGSAGLKSFRSVGPYTATKNQVAATRKTTDLSAMEDVVGTPFGDSESDGKYGPRIMAPATLPLFNEDEAAIPSVCNGLFLQSWRTEAYEAEVGWSGIALQPGDDVEITETLHGFASQRMKVLERTISSEMTVKLLLARGAFTERGFVRLGDGSATDSGKRFW